MADEKIIFSMVGVSKTFTNQKRVLNNIYLSFFYGAKIGIIGLTGSSGSGHRRASIARSSTLSSSQPLHWSIFSYSSP